MSRIKRRRRKINHLKMVLAYLTFIVATTLILTFIVTAIIPMVQYNYQFEEMDPLEELTPSYLNKENFYVDHYLHYEDDHYTSKVGIDVSSHQKEIDFKKVKESGVDFVYIRYGYRGYLDGSLNKDSYFEANYKAAKKAGLEVGVYFFSQATSLLEAMDEAYFVLEGIINKELDLPIVYDLEDIDYAESRMKDTSNQERSQFAMAFAQKIVENNFEAAIYTNLYWTQEVYDLYQIAHYPIWIAQYANELNYPYEAYIWQYSDSGEVPGVSTPTDLNIMFIKK